MDSDKTLDLITAGSGADTRINEALDALGVAACYGRRASTSVGLTWGYYGGRWGGTSIAHGTVALTGSATNYLVVNRSTGAVTASTSATNWNDTTTYARAYKVTTSSSAVSGYEDHRAGANGALTASGPSGIGKHAIFIPASAMQPAVSSGCATLATAATSSGQPDLCTLDFDSSSQEFAQFSIAMPKSWDEGTVTFRPLWSHAAAVTNFGVVWQLQGLAVGDNEAIGQNFGSAQTSTDTGGTAGNQYKGPESSAITIAGSPAAEDTVFFRVGRVPADGSDTLAVDARLHGIVVFITTDAGNDA